MAADRGTGNVAPNKRTTGVRTWGGSADRPQGTVVATAKSPFQYSGGVSSQQNIRNAEANPAPFVSWSDLGSEADAIVANAMTGPNGMPTGGTDYWSTLLKSLQGGSGGGSGSGLSSADVALKELQYRMQQDALDRADALSAQQKQDALNKSIMEQMQNQLATGGYRGNVDAILKMLEDTQTRQTGNIGDVYQKALGNIGGGYDAASTLMGQGYDILDQYLKENPNDPYAGLRAQLTPVQNPMEQFLSAYGVSAPDVQAQVAAEQLAGQQGAGAFNTLADVLSRASQQADKSRALEALMARRGGTAGLAQQRAALTSQAEMGQAQALAQLQQQIAQAKLEQEMSAENARQDLINRIIQSGGTLTGSGPSGTPTAIEQAIRAAGGTTNEAQFQQGLDELAAALGAIGSGADFVPYK
jgi:hypothetical protein